MEKITNIKQKMLENKKNYLIVSSSGFKSDEDFLDSVAAALADGVKFIQYSDNKKSPRDIVALGRRLRQLCCEFDALFILNSRIDIARILCADGVHLNCDDVDLRFAKDILGDEKIVGITVSGLDELNKAICGEADYVILDFIIDGKIPNNSNTSFYIKDDSKNRNTDIKNFVMMKRI